MTETRMVAIWWRVLQRGEFFNIERHPDLVAGGGGARYVEIPMSMKQATLDFFEFSEPELPVGGFTVQAVPFGSTDGVAYPLNFQPKSGNRLRIANQNRQASPDSRHPAWTAEVGFPQAPNNVQTSDEAAEYLPHGGVRIFVARLNDDSLLAGYTAGEAPTAIPTTSPFRRLYVNTGPGGVLWDIDLPSSGG